MYNIRILIILNFKVLQKFFSCHCKKTKISDDNFFFPIPTMVETPLKARSLLIFFSPFTFKKNHAHWKKIEKIYRKQLLLQVLLLLLLLKFRL